MNEKENADTDLFFLSESSRKGLKTSDSKLSLLKERPTTEQCRELLQQFANEQQKQQQQDISKYDNEFNRWLAELKAGFSLMLHGVGSKRQLLQRFRQLCLQSELVLEIDGWSSEATAKSVLACILQDVIGLQPAAKSLLDQAKLVSSELASSDITLYLVVHNIDGPQLRNDKSIDAIVKLCSSCNIRLICSVDHRNSQLLWHRSHLATLRLLHKCTPTFAPYLHEVSPDCGLEPQQLQQLQLSSLHHMMASLTSNARCVLLLLAKTQLDQPNKQIQLDELYWNCLDRMLVTSELTLQAHLKEFRDHKLLRMKSGGECGDTVTLLLPTDTLKQFLMDFAAEFDY